ncbi:MAG: hypothetical protein U0694_15870 [Anaerolineae bacterium]
MVADVDIKWARIVSDVVSPPVVWGLLALALGARESASGEQTMFWAWVYVLLVCIVPVLFIAVRVKQGKITDIHMPLRKERFVPFLVTFILAACNVGILQLAQGSRTIQFVSLVTMVQVALMALITLVWQISVHMIGISGAVVVVALWFGALYGLLMSPLIVVVGMARLVLKRHTLRQVLIGALVGCVSMTVFFLVWN